jgi:hypothetical protein
LHSKKTLAVGGGDKAAQQESKGQKQLKSRKKSVLFLKKRRDFMWVKRTHFNYF